MTVQKAIEALQENDENFSYDVPTKIFEQSTDETMRALAFAGAEEEYQQRSNEEWAELIRKENDPLEAAKLVLDWINNKAFAWEKWKSREEELNAPESQRMSR